MSEPLRICQVSSELAPYAKTGGLGDVTAALSAQLHRAGHDVRMFLPLYGGIDRRRANLQPVEFLQDIPLATSGYGLRYSIYTGQQDDGLWLYFIDCPMLYERGAIYTSDADEHFRFVVLSRATLEACQRMGWSPQIVHCHDWQTGLVPLYLKTLYSWDKLFSNTRTIMSIHNLGYQGVVGADALESTGLSDYRGMLWQDDLENDRINFLKTGLVYADALTTVSPTYADEICTPEYGMGLDGILAERRPNLFGILNGVDYDIWSPERDSLIPHPYSAGNLFGKSQNKTALQRRFGLQTDPRKPLVGVVSRLVYQKGLDLAFEVLPGMLASNRMQLAIVGNGEYRYEEFFQWLEHQFPGRAAFYRGFNNPLAHLVEAGSDIFMMPSLYEPCGLNQMYSLRYGTIPVVRKTGGLADTVKPHYQEDGNGVVFEHADSAGLGWALDTALKLYHDGDRWRQMIANAMACDFSWDRQCDRYVALYRQLTS
ncbi:MAG: glycogen synthase [Gammaproteobacteria bacterium]|nr:glycogen synthase [Gammaproteobacteria bacterium]